MRGRGDDAARAVVEVSGGRARGASAPRVVALDVIRGLCILSMTVAHLAAGSWVFSVSHVVLWVDGAVGFVLISGLVAGLVQRRTVDHRGLRPSVRRVLRRAGVLYLAHLAICAVAFGIVIIDPGRAPTYPSAADLGGVGEAVRASLLLQVNPRLTSILSLYVILLMISVAAMPLLAHRAWPVVLIASVLLYVSGRLLPAAFNLPIHPGMPGAVNWATWQLLFVLAVLLGWYWQSPRVQAVLQSRWALRCTVLTLGVATIIAWLTTTGPEQPWKARVAWFFTEGTLGPGTIGLAFVFVFTLYRASAALVERTVLFDPVARIGRRSLDCYLILSVVVLVLPSALVYLPASWVGLLVCTAVIVLMFGWCWTRDRAAARRRTGPRWPEPGGRARMSGWTAVNRKSR